MTLYGHPVLVGVWAASLGRSAQRARRARLVRRLLRRAALVLASLLVMAAMCYVGPAGAAFDPAPGAAPIAWPPVLVADAAPASVVRRADYEIEGELVRECVPRQRADQLRIVLPVLLSFVALTCFALGRLSGPRKP